MRAFTVSAAIMGLFSFVVFASGCSQQGANDATPVQISGPPPGGSLGGHEVHDHTGDHTSHGEGTGHQGPHQGHVIELGRSHEYHAELVDDEAAGTVSVYILGKNLKELAIKATSITMNLVVDGQPRTFELAAATSGQSSRFDAQDKGLFEALHVHAATGKIRVTIDGAPYSGDVEHHDHEVNPDGHAGHNHG